MAQSISNVRSINDAPKKRVSAKAAKAAAELEARRLKEDESRGLKGPAVDDDFDEETRTAPGFGHNAPDAGVFLRHVQAIRRQQEKVEEAKLATKNERGKLKDIRKLAQADGLVMRELDDALEALAVEHVDLIAREQRRRLYFEWLGIPIDQQQELELHSKEGDAELDAKRWFKRGSTDGRLGRVREIPAGCPPEHIQDWLKGHDEGQEMLMRGLPLTKEGFGDKAEALEQAPPEEPQPRILILNEGHFVAGTILEDANLSTLLEPHHEAFHGSDRVVAVYGTRRRILREPDASVPGGFYVDTGTEDAPISDVEIVPVDAADLA